MSTEQSHQSSESNVPKLWELDGARHPYLHNIFALLGVDPDCGQEEFDRECERLGGRLQAQGAVTRNGRAIDDSHLAHATYLTTREDAFAAERLLAHSSHRITSEAFLGLLAAIDAVSFPAPEELLPLPIANAACLTELLPDLSPRSVDVGALDRTQVRAGLPTRRDDEHGVFY